MRVASSPGSPLLGVSPGRPELSIGVVPGLVKEPEGIWGKASDREEDRMGAWDAVLERLQHSPGSSKQQLSGHRCP